EGGAARRVAERVRAGECDLSILDRICEQYTQAVARKGPGNTAAKRYRSLTRLNKLFHDSVLELSGCSRLQDLMRTQWPLFDRLTLRFALLPEAERLVQEHRGIVEVMRAGMAEEAEAKMREHIVRAGEAVVRYWGGESGGTGGKGVVATR
ncbi:MAG: FCD domain-containing protein, partial [Bacillota bacterium]